MQDTYEANVYKALLKTQEQFDDSTDEWVELELLVSDYAYRNEHKIWYNTIN